MTRLDGPEPPELGAELIAQYEREIAGEKGRWCVRPNVDPAATPQPLLAPHS
jgi:hypothetical protein